jgi:hypothetical protein
MPPELDGSNLTDWAVEFVVEYTNTNTFDHHFGTETTNGNQTLGLQTDIDEGGNTDNGNFRFRFFDSDQNGFSLSPTTNPNLDDGNRHDVTISIDDSTTQSVTIIIDGSEVSISFNANSAADNFTTWDQDMAVWARQDSSGSVAKDNQAAYGAWRWHKTPISSQTINDY